MSEAALPRVLAVIDVMQVGEKTNEIPVFRETLDILDIESKTVTSDAMGCQKAAIEKIIEKKSNYTALLSVVIGL